MIAMAEKYNTAVMSASLLRYSPFLDRFRVRLQDIAPMASLLVPSYGSSLACLSHGVSAVQCVMGEGCEWVESMGPETCDVLRLGYAGSEAVVFSARGHVSGHKVTAANYHHCGYRLSAYGAAGSIHSPRIDDYLFPYGGIRIVRMARAMAETKSPPIPYNSMLELMEMIEGGRLAHKQGRRVYLQEVRS